VKQYLLLAAGLAWSAGLGCSKIVLSYPSPTKIRARTDFDWVEEKTSDGRFQFLIERGALPDDEASSREAQTHAHLQRCFAFLGEPDRGENYTYVLVKSREGVKRLLRVAAQGKAAPEHRMIVGEAAPVLKVSHELFHVVSTRCWGRTEAWLAEGMAVACDDSWWDQDLHSLVHWLRKEGRLLPLGRLLTDFRSGDTMITYPQAGSFAKFLMARGGQTRMKALWQRGGRDLEAIYGEDLAALEKAWLAEVDRTLTESIRYRVP
jgi:hypothetical protein